MYRFLVPGWSAKPLVSAYDRIMGTHTVARGIDAARRYRRHNRDYGEPVGCMLVLSPWAVAGARYGLECERHR